MAHGVVLGLCLLERKRKRTKPHAMFSPRVSRSPAPLASCSGAFFSSVGGAEYTVFLIPDLVLFRSLYFTLVDCSSELSVAACCFEFSDMHGTYEYE